MKTAEGVPVSQSDIDRMLALPDESRVLMDEYVIPTVGMVSAVGEQERVSVYRRLQSIEPQENGEEIIVDWYVGQVANEGDFVYCRQQGNYRSDGFGGRRMLFPLIGGGSVEVQGPWHGNAESLYDATDYDVRDKHYTQCVFGFERGYGLYSAKQVIWYDAEKVLGPFHRGDVIGNFLWMKYGKPIYGWTSSEGGGHSHYFGPEQGR